MDEKSPILSLEFISSWPSPYSAFLHGLRIILDKLAKKDYHTLLEFALGNGDLVFRHTEMLLKEMLRKQDSSWPIFSVVLIEELKKIERELDTQLVPQKEGDRFEFIFFVNFVGAKIALFNSLGIEIDDTNVIQSTVEDIFKQWEEYKKRSQDTKRSLELFKEYLLITCRDIVTDTLILPILTSIQRRSTEPIPTYSYSGPKEAIDKLYQDFLSNGYIAQETDIENFRSLFSGNKIHDPKPIVWTSTKHRLANFIKVALRRMGTHEVWSIAEQRFMCYSKETKGGLVHLNGIQRYANRELNSDDPLWGIIKAFRPDLYGLP